MASRRVEERNASKQKQKIHLYTIQKIQYIIQKCNYDPAKLREKEKLKLH